jgi:ABC-type transport system substrate-binding protein/serine/threonine protein kinase
VIGQKLSNRYEITAELGHGGMGVVYLARDPLLNRDVAVKLIPPNLLSPESEQRFQREAQVVAQMDHPAIVPVYDFGRHESSLFFVMPLVHGENLRAFLRMEALLGEIVDVGIQVAEALEYSHGRGVIHRDVKPENIMVVREGSGVRVRVMDFGLARAATEPRLTQSGVLIGTLTYLSPEQVIGGELDGRSDIYSLGVVLYECFVGWPPFTGDAQSLLYRIVQEVPQSLCSLGTEIDVELEQIVLACLAKAPAKRPQAAGEVAVALRKYRARLRDADRSRSITGLTRTVQSLRPVLQPFVGRTKEFGELQHRLNSAMAGECQFVLVSGEAGVGKTRLLDELESLANARKIRVLHGRTVEQDSSFPYQGFCDLIQESFRLKDTVGAGPPDLTDLAPDLVTLFPMLNEISGLRQGGAKESKPAAAATPEDRTQIFELLARALTRIAGGKPLVLMLEDLHGADVSIEALQYIVRRLGPTPTLLVGTYRSTEVGNRHPLLRLLESFRGDRRFTALSLGPFSPTDHRSYLETLVGGTQLSESLVKKLFDLTKGNPFFAKELVRSLLDAGGISRDDTGEWNLSGEREISSDDLPATIQQAVEKRIARLPEGDRELLAMASVIGNTFDGRDLEALAEGKDVEDALDRLLREGIVEEERESRGDLLTFASGLVRDVLYAGLPRRKRRSLHRRYAEIVETRHAGRLERVLPQLVLHFSQGDVADKAVEYGLRRARASLESWSAEEAARSAKNVLDFLDAEWRGDPALEGDARLLIARACRMSGEVAGALREADAAVRVFEREGLAERAVSALLLGAETAWQARRSEEAARWVDRGLLASRTVADTESRRQLLSLGATVWSLLGEHVKAGEYLEELVRLAPQVEAAVAPDEVPADGRLVVAVASPVGSLEPATVETNEELEIAANVYETLLASDPRGAVVPNLCEKWESSEGGRTFLLTLRRDVRFSDGSPVHARDVKASIETCVRRAGREMPPAYSAIRGTAECRDGKAEAIAGLVVRGDDALEIHLVEPLPIYPSLLTSGTGVVRPVAGAGEGRPRLLGTGPFRIATHERERVVLERNDGYWRGVPARLDTLEFRTYANGAALARAFRGGEVDLARDLLPEDLEEILRDPRFRRGFVETPKKNTYFVLFNSRAGALAAPAGARRALSSVVRTSDLIWRTLGRFAQPAVCLIPPGMLGHDPGRRFRFATLEEAREMLRASGTRLPLRLGAAVHPFFKDRYGSLLARLLAMWSELGIEVEVKVSEMAAFLSSVDEGAGLDLVIARWNADYDDPDNFTHTLFHSRSGLWRNWFSSDAADRLLEEARADARPAMREALYRRLEDLLQEQAALLPLFHEIDYRLAGPKVRGLKLRGTVPYVNYPQIGKAASAAPDAEPLRTGGGIVHVPMAGVVTTLDPPPADTVEEGEVLPSIYEMLTRDAGGARLVPWLAEEMRGEEGGRRYRFRLRDDVRFHDGRRLSARDVRYSYERLLQHPGSDFRWQLSPIKGAKALLEGESRDLAGFHIHSASEFTIELEEPVAFFPALISNPATAILPEGALPSAAAGPEGWVGTGPFRVVAFEPNRRLELERHRGYWRPGYPRSDGLVFSFNVQPKDIVSGFRSGRFSLAADLFPADVEALRREADFVSGYRETPRLNTYFAAFNIRSGPLVDRALRQRLVRALDVSKLVQRTLGRLALPASGLIPPGLLGHGSSASHPAPRPSSVPEVTVGMVELTAAVNPIFFGGYSGFASELETALEQLGVKVRIVNKTIDEMVEAQKKAAVDLTLSRWSADYPDADTFVHIVHSQEGHLGRLCGLPEIDRLIERGRTETAPSARHTLYREVEETIAREAIVLPLFHEQAYRFARPEIEGLAVSFGIPTVAYDGLRIRG